MASPTGRSYVFKAGYHKGASAPRLIKQVVGDDCWVIFVRHASHSVHPAGDCLDVLLQQLQDLVTPAMSRSGLLVHSYCRSFSAARHANKMTRDVLCMAPWHAQSYKVAKGDCD